MRGIVWVMALGMALAGCGDGGGPTESTPRDTTSPPVGTNPNPPGGNASPADCLRPLVGTAPTASFAAPASSLDLPLLGQGGVSERFTAEVAERGGYAYTSTWGRRSPGNVLGNTVKVWDVRGAAPVLVDSLLVAGAVTTGDAQVSDDGKLLVVPTEGAFANNAPSNGLAIFDRTDPAHPRLLTTFASAATASGVHTVKLSRIGGKLYAFLAIDPSPQQLVVLDLSNPGSPVQVLVKPMGNPFIHDVFVRDGLLFTALWNDGFTIWDVGGCRQGGTPASPVQLLTFLTEGGAVHNLWWLHSPDGSRRYVLVGEEQAGQIGVSAKGDIHVVDIADPALPREVAFFTVAGAGTHNFSVDEAHQVLYAAYYNGGVRAIDLRGDLGACPAAARATDGRCSLALAGRELGHALTGVQNVYIWGVVFDAGKVFASDMVHGLYELDASALSR